MDPLYYGLMFMSKVVRERGHRSRFTLSKMVASVPTLTLVLLLAALHNDMPELEEARDAEINRSCLLPASAECSGYTEALEDALEGIGQADPDNARGLLPRTCRQIC